MEEMGRVGVRKERNLHGKKDSENSSLWSPEFKLFQGNNSLSDKNRVHDHVHRVK